MQKELVAQIAADQGICESCLHRWTDLADGKDGHEPGLNNDDRAGLVRLRREKRDLEMGIEVLKRVSVYFTRENILLE